MLNVADSLHFVPLALIALAGALWLLERVAPLLGIGRRSTNADIEAKRLSACVEDHDDDFESKLEAIAGKNFQKKEVVLDGKHFINCNLEDVTLVHNGGHFKVTGGWMRGNIIIRTYTPGIQRFLDLLIMTGGVQGPVFNENDGPHDFAELARRAKLNIIRHPSLPPRS